MNGVAKMAGRFRSSLLRGSGTAAVVAAVTMIVPDSVRACSVCYGNAAGPMIDGAAMAVYLMLGVTAVVLGLIATFMFYLYRQARRVAREENGSAVVLDFEAARERVRRTPGMADPEPAR